MKRDRPIHVVVGILLGMVFWALLIASVMGMLESAR